jgi:hypothetical protein
VLLRLAYLGVTNALVMLRLLPMSDQAKDAEILALRHQITVLERQLQGQRVRCAPADRAILAAEPLARSVWSSTPWCCGTPATSTPRCDRLRADGHLVHDEDVARLSPLGHAHISMLGRDAFSLRADPGAAPAA